METKTDVVRNVKNAPCITAIESKIPNVWYTEKLDHLFALTANGFMMIKGSKKDLPK